jgi:hypothetical protein
MDNITSGVVTIATAIVGVAILAVLVSRNANTAGVIKAASGGFAQAITAATGPVTGGGGGLSWGSMQGTFGFQPAF